MRKSAFAMALCLSLACNAKDIKTVVVTTSPQMHCENCENKIKSNIRFEKGVKDITTDLETKTVTIKYDADKTTVDNIVAGFAKIDYKATVVDGNNAAAAAEAQPEAKKSSCCGSGSCKCGSGTPCGSSCGSEKSAEAGQTVAYFKAVQMRCGGCAGKVKNALEAVEGVSSADVDLATKSVKVSYDASKADVEKLKSAFYGIQYASQLYYPEDSNVQYVTFQADQMKCGGCAGKVKRNISAEEGVKDVTVCLETKAVAVAYDSTKTSVDKLVDAFKKFDYTVAEIYNK